MKITVKVEPGVVEIPDDELNSRTASEACDYIAGRVREWLKSDARVEWECLTCHDSPELEQVRAA